MVTSVAEFLGDDAATRAFEVILGGSLFGFCLDWVKSRRDEKRKRRRDPAEEDALELANASQGIAMLAATRAELVLDVQRVRVDRDHAYDLLERERTERDVERREHDEERRAWHDRDARRRAEIEALEEQMREERAAADRRYAGLLAQLAELRSRYDESEPTP